MRPWWVVLLLYAVPAAAQDNIMPVTRSALGWTACDHLGVPSSWIKSGLDSATTLEVEQHEAVHREQAARYPSCAEYEATWRADVRLELDLEAEAYCRTMPPNTPRGGEQLTTFLWYLFRTRNVEVGQIAQAVTKYCLPSPY